jgi:ribonuclease Y
VIGADLCEKYGEAKDIVYAVRAHHEDVRPESWLDFLVIGADAISGARPGARREQLDNYVRRLEDLERIANAFPGVERSFAIAAGREIRVMVENSRVNDEQAVVLSRDIAKKIEQDMTFPGQIKVTVIRETRVTSLAK